MTSILASVTILVMVASPALAASWKTYSTGTYSFQYPSNWNLKEKENRFTTIDAVLNNGRSSISFESSREPVLVNDETMLGIMEEVKQENYLDAQIYEKGTDKYTINGQTAPYVIATYTKLGLFGGEHKNVVLTVLIKTSGKYVLFNYDSPANDFDGDLATAEQVLKSITMLG